MLRHLQSLVGERHPDSAPRALRKAAEYLAARFSEYGWVTSGQPFRALGKSYFNILAVKWPPGRSAKDAPPPLLIGAHYDTIIGSPGADDNASALVILLEAAERLRDFDVARPVWLAAFCLEEQGLLGSRAFITGLKQTGQPLDGAIILECVGFASRDPGSQRTPPGVPIPIPSVGNFLGIVGNEASRELVVAVERNARRFSPNTPTVALTVPARGESLPDVRRSDHAAFWDEGYRAVMLTDTANFRNPHYHEPTDTLETLDLDFLEGVSEIVVGCIEDLAGSSRQ
ncbi:MAG TPA: M20/M25/M40 family metallo-hydrolase [Nitrospira sp.]|nr:M20/M25/M40 family metallo-hydrolase [Nitrospira sp.]